jgi:NitT/TauT family transport system substrate-binding protein
MSTRHARRFSRRQFLGGVTLAGTAGLLGVHPRPVAAEPPPETTTIRLVRSPSSCLAPQYVAEELLHGEGFTEVHYVQLQVGSDRALASGEADISLTFSASIDRRVDAGEPIVCLAGVHIGCYKLFGSDRVRAIRDLKGKTVALREVGTPEHSFLAAILTYVGLDPRKDVNWAPLSLVESMPLLAEGKIDAILAFPPLSQELGAKQIGHVVMNSMMDRPWSHYFCCMVGGNREFVRQHPVATKRAVRAILKATDLCAREPERVARFLLDKGHAKDYDYALQGLKDIPYDKWREYDPEDTLRFYALRLHEAGMIKSTPQKIIAQGTDWRFLNELKKELKG